MIAADATLREELAACADLGIPHSQFLGGDGRWRALDRAKALGYRRYERSLCPRCKTSDELWKKDPQALTWDTVQCKGCYQIELGQESLQESKAKGMSIVLLPPDMISDEVDQRASYAEAEL